jgi:aminoglycoside phosphotransferase (APT) family kinase protein
MALRNDVDLARTAALLRDWIVAKVPAANGVAIDDLTIPQASGMSMTTILFRASWQAAGARHIHELVLRLAPTTPGVVRDPDLVREFELLRRLGEQTSVPVPVVRWVETDAAVLGAPFLVMDRAAGRVPSDDPPYTTSGWVMDLDVTDRPKLCQQALRALAEIHRVDYESAGLGFLDRPEFGSAGIEQAIGYWEDMHNWAAADRPSPTIDAAFEWARANMPRDERICLTWGDARIGNIVYSPDLSVAAVLDWELAALGSPEADLGWFVFIIRYYSDGMGIPLPAGLQSVEQCVRLYAEYSGHSVVNIDYYEAFAALKMSVLLYRVGRLMIDYGMLPADSAMPMNNPASQLLATLTGVPSPSGTAEYILGHR